MSDIQNQAYLRNQAVNQNYYTAEIYYFCSFSRAMIKCTWIIDSESFKDQVYVTTGNKLKFYSICKFWNHSY